MHKEDGVWKCFNCATEVTPDTTLKPDAPAGDIQEAIQKPKPDTTLTPDATVIFNLTREQKTRIAWEAHSDGVKKVALKYGLEWKTVRSWQGVFCRAGAPPPEKKVSLDIIPLQGLPEWNNDWTENVMLKWLDIYKEIRKWN